MSLGQSLSEQLAWVDDLSARGVINELRKRGLRLEGDEVLQRARLRRSERYRLLGLPAPISPIGANFNLLVTPASEQDAPDSPGLEDGAGSDYNGSPSASREVPLAGNTAEVHGTRHVRLPDPLGFEPTCGSTRHPHFLRPGLEERVGTGDNGPPDWSRGGPTRPREGPTWEENTRSRRSRAPGSPDPWDVGPECEPTRRTHPYASHWGEGAYPRSRTGYSRPPARDVTSAADVHQILKRWNLKFSGARGSDGEAFLLRLQESRAMIPVSDQQLFTALPFFLTGTALYWFRHKRSQLYTWEDFETAWRARFGRPDFQFAIRDELFRRTQGEHEPFAEYLTSMHALFDRLEPPWSLREQLDCVHRNMLPKFQIAVNREDVRDFETMERRVTSVERGHEASRNYRAPPAAERSLFPDLAYRPRKDPRHSAVAAAGIAENPAKKGGSARRTRKREAAATAEDEGEAPVVAIAATNRSSAVKCWNCEKTGHISRECKQPRKLHCFSCGKQNVTIKSCLSCTGNGEGSR